jgi:lysophospholipase L1-like esterase
MRALKNLTLLLVSLAVALAASELGLRIAGYRFAPTLENVEFGWPNREVRKVAYRSDPDLFWVPHGYEQRIAALQSVRPDLLFMGDSCTEWGRWTRMLEKEIQARHLDRTILTGVLGVGGWSSFQGLQQLRRDALPLRPRAITFWYGWNDHWRGMGVDDAAVHAISRPAFPGLRRLRLDQLWLESQLSWRLWRQGPAPERVAPESFRANLTAMVRESRAAGAVPVLLTAASNHRVGSEPAHLSPRWIEDLSQLVPVHQRYVEIVREVAGRERAPLCDLEARFASLGDGERTAFFALDGIHFTKEGDEQLARFLLECFEADAELRALWAAATP